MQMKHISILLLSGFAIGLAGGSALAADPPTQSHSVRAAGGEVIEFGSFNCSAQKSADQLTWSCPAQSFASKFKDVPTVLLSVAGFSSLAATDGNLSLAIDIKEDVRKEGFQPIVDETGGKIGSTEKSSIAVTWIAIGEGERGQRTRPVSKAERLKLREMRRDDKANEK